MQVTTTGTVRPIQPEAEFALLLRAVRAAAAGQSVLAPSVARRLMSRVRGPSPEVLSQRELEVLSLVAAGAPCWRPSASVGCPGR